MIRQVRRFNRTVTQRVGALDDRFLARDRPLGDARVLWEIGDDGCDVRSLRSRLDLDSGYLSRLLRSLEGDGLITVGPSESDRRVRTAQLTAAGAAERAVLDRRSDELAASLLEPLNAAQRARLVAAMGDVERLLTAAIVEIAPVDPLDPAPSTACTQYFSRARPTLRDRLRPAAEPSCRAISSDRRPACSCSPRCAQIRSVAAP